SFAPEVRKQLLEGIARVARGEAIAAGMPEALYPVVTVSGEFVPSTFNTPPLSGRLKQLFTARFGEDRVHETPPAMAGEDFGRFHLADPTVESTIFTVGGMHPAAVEGSGASRTTLHSPFWAPDAEVVIGTATEAMTAAALHLLGDCTLSAGPSLCERWARPTGRVRPSQGWAWSDVGTGRRGVRLRPVRPGGRGVELRPGRQDGQQAPDDADVLGRGVEGDRPERLLAYRSEAMHQQDGKPGEDAERARSEPDAIADDDEK